MGLSPNAYGLILNGDRRYEIRRVSRVDLDKKVAIPIRRSFVRTLRKNTRAGKAGKPITLSTDQVDISGGRVAAIHIKETSDAQR